MKMNILLSSLAGNEKTESIHYLRVLRRLGHNVYRLNLPTYVDMQDHGQWLEPGFTPEVNLQAITRLAGFAPDLLLYIEPHGLIPVGLEQAPFVTACILCDTHVALYIRQRLARFFDHVFLYHRNYLSMFNKHSSDHVHWLPYACDLELFHPLGVERDLDIAFIGQISLSARASLIDRLSKSYKMNDIRFYYQREIPTVYSRSKIVLNLPLSDDLNFRTFEAMSCGAMLLTRRVNNGQEILFQEGKHYAAYADEQELFQKVGYYLAHPDEREAIAAAGLEEVQRHHSLEQRIQELLSTVVSKPEKVAPIRHMPANEVDRQYAWYYEELQRAYPGPGLTLLRQARQAGRPWLGLLWPVIRSLVRGAIYS